MKFLSVVVLMVSLSTTVEGERAEGAGGRVQKNTARRAHALEVKKTEVEQGQGALLANVLENTKTEAEQVEAKEHQKDTHHANATVSEIKKTEFLDPAGTCGMQTKLGTLKDDMWNNYVNSDTETQEHKKAAERIIRDIEWFLVSGNYGDARHMGLFCVMLLVRMTTIGLASNFASQMTGSCFDNYLTNAVPRAIIPNSVKIRFGQKAVACTFTTGGTEFWEEYKDDIDDQPLPDVALKLQETRIPRDLVPVQVAWFTGETPGWYSINNRGFTMHNLAKQMPLRILPRLPTTAEEARFTPNGQGEGRPSKPRTYIYLEDNCPANYDLEEAMRVLPNSGRWQSDAHYMTNNGWLNAGFDKRVQGKITGRPFITGEG